MPRIEFISSRYFARNAWKCRGLVGTPQPFHDESSRCPFLPVLADRARHRTSILSSIWGSWRVESRVSAIAYFFSLLNSQSRRRCCWQKCASSILGCCKYDGVHSCCLFLFQHLSAPFSIPCRRRKILPSSECLSFGWGSRSNSINSTRIDQIARSTWAIGFIL